jgi:hypothetical protein
MTKLLLKQADLFAAPIVPIALTDPERRKAVALLQALLTEAVTKPPHQPSVFDKKEIGNE